MGLAPIMVQKIFEVIRAVAAEGMTILLIEQNAKLALETSQRGYVMESGEITLTDDAAKLLHDPKVRKPISASESRPWRCSSGKRRPRAPSVLQRRRSRRQGIPSCRQTTVPRVVRD